jgi:hypothetical protein
VLSVIGANVLVDEAYQGLWRWLGDHVIVPRLTKRAATKTSEQKLREHRFSGQRMPVEHGIGRMKWWRELHYWRLPPNTSRSSAKPLPHSPPSPDRANLADLIQHVPIANPPRGFRRQERIEQLRIVPLVAPEPVGLAHAREPPRVLPSVRVQDHVGDV